MTFSTRPCLRRLQRRTTGVASQHRADETFKTFSLVSAEAVENASAEWKAALVAFDDACPPLPIMWSNWREAKEWDRQRDEFVKLQRQTLEDAREHKSRLACLEIAPAHARESVSGGPGRTQRVCAINARFSIKEARNGT